MEKKKNITFNNFIEKLSTRNYVNLLLILLSSLSFFLIVFNRKANLIRPLSLLVQFRPYISLPLFGIVLFFLLSIKFENLKKPAVFFLVGTLFALSLAGVWANTQTENYMLAGLIPNSDASYQYSGALKLLDFGELNGTASRRPFFGELMATLLALTNRNLQITIAIIVFLVAISTWFAALEIHYTFGRISSIGFLFLIFLYYARFVGTTMTENLGLIFGLLSFTLFLGSIRIISINMKESKILFILGTFLYSLGQNARPGAVLMIPLFVLLSGLLFCEGKRSFNWKIIIPAIIAGLLPFIVNQLHFSLNGSEGSMPMANMAYGLYGFVKGGMKWNQIIFDYPDITKLPINEQTRQMFHYIFLEITQNPQNIIKGFLIEFKTLFEMNSQAGLLSFIQFDSYLPNIVFSVLVIFLYAIGLLRIFTRENPWIKLFLLSIILGFIFSLPIAPASQTQYMRTYAVSLPFLIFIPIYGLELIISKLPFKSLSNKKDENLSKDNRIFSALFAAAIIFSPLILLILNTGAPKIFAECPKEQATSVVFYNPGSAINIVEDKQIILDWVPNIHQARFRNKIHNICCEDDISFFESLSAPVSIFTSIDNIAGNSKYFVIADSDMLPDERGWLQLCGSVSDIYGNPATQGFFYPEKIYKLN